MNETREAPRTELDERCETLTSGIRLRGTGDDDRDAPFVAGAEADAGDARRSAA